MTKKNNTIWYDWNSPSGFELFEIENQRMENQRMNVQVEKRKAAQVIELKHYKKAACSCKCNCALKEAQ